MGTQEAAVRVGLLGPVVAWVDGAPAGFGGPLPKALLARLALAEGRVVPDATLIDDLWGEEPPRSALTTLQGYVAGLRRALEPQRTANEATVVVRRGPGYALRTAPGAVDSDQFSEWAARAVDALASGDAATAEATGRRALGLWRGPALADCGDREFAAVAAARLEDLRAGLQETTWAAQLALGRHLEVAAAIEGFTREHPLRERGWELLALAQYRSGRQADALATLRSARDVLDEELGADPGPALTALSRAVLRQDPSLDLPAGRRPAAAAGATALATAPARARPAGPGTTAVALEEPAVALEEPAVAPGRGPGRPAALPVAVTPFRGRSADLAAVDRLLTDHRLVTVAATGGMGKTRLALAVAAAREDVEARVFVDLAPVTDGDRVVDVVAAALGASGATPAELAAVVRNRAVLLVMDNCEQVAAAVAATVTELLARCPQLRVLATSREPLLLPGERVHPLLSLPEADAVALFEERAAAADPGWAPTGETRALVARVCASLEGIPLAIELAAAQCRVLSVAQVAELVDDRMALLWGGGRGPGRHATMRASVAWSVDQLAPDERAVFLELAVFGGGFDLAAAVAVTGRPDVLLPLTRLVDTSLVSVVGGDPRRYRVLEVLRRFAAELREPEHDSQLRARHARWVRSVTDGADLALRGPDSAAWMRSLADDAADVRIALDHCLAEDPATALEIAAGMYWFWYRRGPVTEGLRQLEAALAAVDAAPEVRVPTSTRVRAQVGRVLLTYLRGDLAAVLEALGRLGSLGAAATDPADRAYAFATISFFEAGAGATDAARQHATLALDAAEELGLEHVRAEALMCLGTAAFREGDHDTAARDLGLSVRTAEAAGYTWCAVSATWLLAKSRLAAGDDLADVAASLVRAADACAREDDVTSWLVVVATLAHVAWRGGLTGLALELTGVVAERGEDVGLVPEAMDPLDLAGYAAQLRAAVPPEEHAAGVDRGRRLDADEVDGRLHALPGLLAADRAAG